MKNLNVAVREWQDEVVFLHKIVDGAADKSYGIHVARLAGVPREVIERAKEILAQLEEEHLDAEGHAKIARPARHVRPAKPPADALRPGRPSRARRDPAGRTSTPPRPLDALRLVHEWQEKLKIEEEASLKGSGALGTRSQAPAWERPSAKLCFASQ